MLRTVDIIQKKRDGHELSTAEIQHMIQGYGREAIPDYQISAWLMAIYFQGMNARETADLTMAMAHSGELIDLDAIHGIKVDKHSTGGVGDTATLVLAPLVAAAGVPVAKMSGRGLGHTGGTVDKLEAITGFSVERTAAQFIDQVNRDGIAVIGQTGNITPADKQLYALRDVTGTVNSIPLIASSIMSKKIASGANAIVLDVKTGKGAFMKTLEQSIALAQAMVDIGEQVGRETVAIVSDMNQPLGYAIGNALEVKEAIMTLQGNGPKDLEELCLVLGANMLVVGKKAENHNHGREILVELLHNGKALEKFKQLVLAQDGDVQVIDHPELFANAGGVVSVVSEMTGYVSAIEAEAIGVAAMLLGAGRETKDSVIDPSVGIVLHKKVGDHVQQGDTLADIHKNGITSASLAESMIKRVRGAYSISVDCPQSNPLIYAIVSKDGTEIYK